MERALRSFTSTLVLGLIVLAPTFTSGLVALRLPFLSTESIAAHSTLGRDRVVVQARARRATQGIRTELLSPPRIQFIVPWLALTKVKRPPVCGHQASSPTYRHVFVLLGLG